MEHEIKIDKNYFRAVIEGDKNFEIRYNDRGYQKGDRVLMREVAGISSFYTDEWVEAEITYVTGFEQKENWVVFGFKVIESSKDETG